MPAAIVSSIAFRPSWVPGILTNRLGRSTIACSRLASATVACGVMGEVRVDLERDPAVAGRLAAVEHRAPAGRRRRGCPRAARARKTSLGSCSVLRAPPAAARRRRRPRRSPPGRSWGSRSRPTIPSSISSASSPSRTKGREMVVDPRTLAVLGESLQWSGHVGLLWLASPLRYPRSGAHAHRLTQERGRPPPNNPACTWPTSPARRDANCARWSGPRHPPIPCYVTG